VSLPGKVLEFWEVVFRNHKMSAAFKTRFDRRPPNAVDRAGSTVPQEDCIWRIFTGLIDMLVQLH
jgi:hypothetical protein